MIQKLKILIVDDHPIIIEGYKKILLDNLVDLGKLIIETANSCDEANRRIENSLKSGSYDLVFLDISLPPSKDHQYLSGEDLGLKIKEHSPTTKLIILTMINDNIRLVNILRTINPEGLLIKSDVTADELLLSVKKVLQGKKISSYTVENLMRNQITNVVELDKIDRQILLYLSEGIKTKDLPEVIPISLTAIEKRKKNMRVAFEIEDFRDITLLNKARKLGFI